MIQVFSSDQKAIGQFKDYDQLVKHLNTLENDKLSQCSSRAPSETWSFAIYSHKRLSYIYYKTLERSFNQAGKEAFEQELDLIEIYKGTFQNPLQIPASKDVDVQSLKEDWCHDYCEAHNYLLVDYRQTFESQTFPHKVANTGQGNMLLTHKK